jgi:DNA-binding NarL/FixJ family response regulator
MQYSAHVLKQLLRTPLEADMTFQRRILVVEDDPLMGSLMVEALSHQGFETQLCSGAASATKALKAFDPDGVLVDIDLGDGPNGVDLIRIVRSAYPHIAAILLSNHPDLQSAGFRDESLPEGVAYLRKNLLKNTSELVSAIEDVMRGNSSHLRQDLGNKGRLELLTKVQREILEMIAMGMSNAEIARRRKVGISAVEKRASEIFKTFGIDREESVVPRVMATRIYYAEIGAKTRPKT